ncbi:hypothetical protein J437_LFUL007851 [Ladona fulva]|uniref:Alpha-2-macroglobulin domain-containing protein n=1 Tax=Ladona fulva TaxID=123851 RepID=A0A8K0K5I9_LADFU|nr:hypothetical protein J437_LFUL007851 [Ladona fulva]
MREYVNAVFHATELCNPDASGGRGLSVRLNAPPDAGKWILRAVALSRRWGVRVSPPLPVSAFRPLATHFRLPASLRVGEALEVDVKIVNNINSCLDVSIPPIPTSAFTNSRKGIMEG